MLCTLVMKGSKTSGWYSPPRGTHSGDKHRATGSGKAVKSTKKVRVVSKKATKGVGDNRETFYHAKGTEQLPKDITSMENGALLYQPGKGLYVHDAGRSPDNVLHTLLFDAAGLDGRKDDEWARPRIMDGRVHMFMSQMGSLDPESKTAERYVVGAAKAMLAAGFSPSLPVSWWTGPTAENEIRLTLKQMSK